MKINLASVIIDAAELEPESAFWHRLLGGSITKTETHHFLRIDGFPVFVIQRAPGAQPSKLAGGHPTTNAHRPDEGRPRGRRQTGARRRRTSLRPTEDVDPTAQNGAQVYASPAGHPFCLRSSW